MFTKKTRVISAIATVCMLISMLACIAVPAYAEDLSSYPSVTTVNEAADRTGTDYTVANATEWMHFYAKYNFFQSTDVTIHIIGEIDMTGQTGFASIYNPQFNIDGHGNTIKNWGTAAAPQKTMGMFRFNCDDGKMSFIKNLTLDNCHTTGSGGSDSTLLVTLNGSDNTGRALSDNLTFENVHIKNCSLTAEAARSGFFVANYVNSAKDYTVTLKNCSLTGSTLHGTTNGHSGLLIGKASSFNGKKATYNLTNVYVAGNTMNCKRNNYVGLGIGNVEVNTNSIAPMQLNINNVVFEGNTLNSVSETPALFGNLAATGVSINGLVFEDTTVTNTTTETGRYMFVAGGGSCAFDLSNTYCDDATVAGAVGGTATGLKTGEANFTVGAAAAAANAAASSDSLFWYTTTADGVALGTATNATRKVTLELGTGEVVGTYYANVGATVEVAYAEEPDATFAIKEGSSGSINGKVVTITENKDVVVAVGLGAAEELANAKAVLQTAINYFKVDRNINYFNDTVKTAVAEAEALLAGEDTEAILAKKAALDALQGTNYAGTKENAPSMTEIAKYPGAPIYVIRTAADFQAMEDNKAKFDVDDTIYMMNDIDMKGSTFNGIEAFKASFDGQGYTIKNWGIAADGTTKAPITTRGLFYNAYGAAAAIKSIKNVSFENCHTIGGSTAAMLYGVGHANAGMAAAGAATTLTLENIHFNGCSITAPSTKHEVAAFLLARYMVAGKNTTVNVKNCSVVGSTLDYDGTDAGGGHFGLLIGKPRNGNAGETTVYNLTDCYVGGNTVEYSRADGNYTGVVFGTAEAMGDFTVNIKNLGVVDNTIKVGGTHIALVGDVQGTKTNVDGLLVEGNTATGGSMVLFNNGAAVTLKNTFCSDTLSKVTTTGSATLTGTNTDAAAAYAVNTVSGGNLWWTTTEGAAVKGAATNATRKVELKLGTGEIVGTYYANVGETVTVAYAEEPGAEFSIAGESGTIADGNKVTVNKNADVVVAVSLGASQELANAKEALQAAINYYKVDRNINYFKAEVATAVAEAEELLASSNDTAAILAKKDALDALKGEVVDVYPNVPAISEMSKYPAVKNYKIMTADELIAADTTALRADGITLHLGANIDLTGKSFDGFDSASCDFDGHGFTVANWTCNNTVGMFGNYKGGTIKNLTVDNANIGGGYGRAVFAGNGVEGNTTFENVHVKNTVVAENSDGNLGGIFFGQITKACVGTIKNCSVVDTEFKTNLTGNAAGITNTGVICGRCGKGGETYVVEGLYVDGFMNNANPATVSKGNGILLGTIEGNLASATVDGAIIVNCGGTAAYELAGWQYNDKVLTYKNIFAAGNDTLALNGGSSPIANTTVENIFTDSTNLFATFISGSDSAHKDVATELEGITVMDAAAFKTGEAAYKFNAAAGKALALVNDSFNAYPVLFATEGYAAPKAVTFKDLSDNDKIVATFYTNASGKLSAAAAEVLDGAAYDWKLADADVTIDTVFTADSVVTSNATHNWENGTYEQLDNGQHKLICGDEGCDVYKIEDCAAAETKHRLDGEKHVHDTFCVCERVLATADCEIRILGVGADGKHNVACDVCDYEADIDCVFTGWAHDDATVGENATHTGTCACGATKTAACSFGDWIPVNAADLGVCGVDKKVCADCGYEYTRTSAMKTETAVEIEAETVDLGVNPEAKIYLNIDELGLAGAKVIINTHLEIGACELNDEIFVEFEEVEGGIEIVFANDENLTGKVLLATLGFAAPATAGEFEVKVDVEDAVVISGEGEEATELPAEVAGAIASLTVREAIEGDVNGDGEITMADAVLVLRVVNGTLDAGKISSVGADVDGVDGLTTADAIAILQMVMANY